MTDSERVLLEQMQGLIEKWRKWKTYEPCADDLAALLRAIPQTAEPETAVDCNHDFKDYVVCCKCGQTAAATGDCHHCNDPESQRNRRCWWCLRPASPVPSSPYQTAEPATEWGGTSPYDPAFGDDKLCECGHPYYRHFDTYEQMAPIGCKYCSCSRWTQPRETEDR